MAKKKPRAFEELPRSEQAARVAELMQAGGSYRRAARELKTTVGRVAGLCRDFGIGSSNPPPFAPAVPDASAPVPPKLAASEATQCAARIDGLRCAYEREPGSRYCKRHR